MSDDNIYAGPRANSGYVYQAREDDPVDAPRLTRLGAVVVDALAPAFLVVPVAGLAGALGALGNLHEAWSSGVAFLFVVPFLGWVAWNFLLFHREGQTFGKRMLGIRVVRTDGSRCSLMRWIFLRHFVTGLIGAIPYLGALVTLVGYLIIFREDSRCLHDHIADTRVVVA